MPVVYKTTKSRWRAKLALSIGLALATATANALPPFAFNVPRPTPVRNFCWKVLGHVGIGSGVDESALGILKRRGLRVVEELGSGGAGTVVHAAGHDSLGREVHVAIKQNLPSIPVSYDALRAEYALLKKAYPNEDVELVAGTDNSLALVVRLFPRNTEGPLRRAPTVHDLFTEPRLSVASGKHDLAFIDRLGIALTDELVGIHDRGVIHADVKPKNVLMQMDEGRVRARYIDFGLSGEPGDKVNGGSPGYIGLDGALSKKLAQSRDIFGLQRMLLDIYYRDFFAGKDRPDATNVTDRGFPGWFQQKDMALTMENGEHGVKPEIAWVLRSTAFRTSKDFQRLYASARASKDMSKFLAELRPLFVETWENGDTYQREDLLADLARSPKYRAEFIKDLPKKVREELVERLDVEADYAREGHIIMKPFGMYPAILPQLPQLRRELTK